MRTLYLIENGGKYSHEKSDIPNHVLRTIENVDIIFNGKTYNMFLEFHQWDHWKYRLNNKRNGQPLKKPIRELVNDNGIFIHSSYTKQEYDPVKVYHYTVTYGHCEFEKEVNDQNYNWTKEDILEVVNKYATEKYDKLVLVEEESSKITMEKGGYREKSILANDSVFIPTETWNDDHKVVRVTERINNKMGNSYEVDLVTNRITN